MNIVQLQDLLKGLPDNRLKQEMDQPSGTVPQYLVLSEIVRRDKMRTTGMAQSPTTTVVQDVMNQQPGPQAMPPEEMPQEQAPQGYASGGFISAADAMGGAGVRGFTPPAPKQPPMFGPNYGGPGMFTPNTAPKAPTPMTNNNFNLSQPQPQFDGGQVNDMNSPSFYQQGAYADGGTVRYGIGGKITSAESSNDPRAKNPMSTATGAGQFIESTWLETIEKMKPGIVKRIGREAALNLRYDPVLSKQATEVYAADNRDKLTRRGFEPTEGNLYLAHFAGPSGASALLSADPSASAGAILGEKVVKANPFLKNMSVADIKNWAANKMSSKPSGNAMAGNAGAKPGEGTMALAEIARGTGSNTGGIASLPDGNTEAFMPELATFGKALASNRNEAPMPEIPDMVPGSAELAAGTRTKSPEEQIAEYIALRRGYMANGGAVRMQDGPPNGDAVRAPTDENPLTEEEAQRYLQLQQFGNIFGAGLKDAATAGWRYVGKGANALGISGLIGAATGDPNFEFPTSSYLDELYQSGGADAPTPEEVKRLQTQYANEQTMAEPINPEISYRPEGGVTLSGGIPKLPESPAMAPPPEPTAEDKYIKYLEDRDKRLADLYDQQVKAEQKQRAQATGLPAFLRQLGLGMLSNNRSMGESLQAGLAGAIGSREEEDAAARDRIRALQLKKEMGGIEGLGDIAELKYKTEIAKREAAQKGIPGAADYIPVLDDLLKALSSAEEAADAGMRDRATDPAVIRATQMLNDALSKTGLGGTIGTTGQYNWTGTGIEPVQ
jgi:hypothetical protein